ncbi:MAG: S-layer homology domain-containing protein [Clostridia bacterium]|nr:S-layer homology domain-containing protein [Clostridia bacterium]
MKKRGILAILIAAVMIAAIAAPCIAASKTGYDDVPDDAWYAEAAAHLKSKDIMNGTGDNKFSPDDVFTRAQLATVLYRIAGEPAVTGEDSFTDTQDGLWYSDAVLWAEQNNIVNGIGGGLFGTNNATTQEQLATMLWRMAGEPAASAASDSSAYAAQAATWAREKQIAPTSAYYTFTPKADATRAQVAALVSAYLAMSESSSLNTVDLSEAMKTIPESYTTAAAKQGEIVRFDYDTAAGSKYAYVYVPYGYDSSKQYDILYIMHGGGGSAETLFGGADQSNDIKNAIDHLIENGEMAPILIVTPTFYTNAHNDSSVNGSYDAVREFPNELANYLMPSVESAYSTYAPTADAAGFKASREHRAFGGFSMGSVTTWFVFEQLLDDFATFIPISGDSWTVSMQGGQSQAKETAEKLAQAVADQGYTANDFFIYAMTGTDDIAQPMMTAQLDAMRQYTDTFRFTSSDMSAGNITYRVHEGGVHDMPNVKIYLYNALPDIWGGVNTDAAAPAAPASDTEKKALVIYFDYAENVDPGDMDVDAVSSASLDGRLNQNIRTLKVMADEIQSLKNADVFSIQINERYSADYETMVSIAQKDQQNDKQFTFRKTLPDLEQYDTIYFGTPVWWGQLPQPVKVFLEQNSFAGKTVVPFGINLGSGFGRILTQYSELMPDANIAEGITISASTTNESAKAQTAEFFS